MLNTEDKPARGALTYALPATFAASAYAYALSRGSDTPLFAAQGVAILTLAVALALGLAKVARRTLTFYFVFALVVILQYLSLLANIDTYSDGGAVTRTLLQLSAFSIAWGGLIAIGNGALWPVFLRRLGLLILPLCILAIVVAPASLKFGRAEPFGIQPNWWGELSIALCICAMTLRPRYRIVVYATAAILDYWVQSRSGWVGLVTIWLIEALAMAYRVNWRMKSMATMAACAALIGLVNSPALSFVSNKILLLHNEDRGLGTGLTGRLQGWIDALRASEQKPLLGYGPGAYADVHNGYLRILAEGGYPLTLIVIAAIAVAAWSAFSHRNWVRLAAVAAPAIYIVFEPRAFNLNLTSAVFWMAVGGMRVRHQKLSEGHADA